MPPALTFLGSIAKPVKAEFYSLRRIRFLCGSCGPVGSLSGFLPMHCYPGGSPFENSPRYHYLAEFSFAVPSLENSGAAGRFEKWERHRLSLLPHASSSLALPSVYATQSLRMSAVFTGAAALSIRPFPADHSPPRKCRLSLPIESHNLNLPVDKKDIGDNSVP